MYANFKRILKQQKPMRIPRELIDQLNKDLPEGLEYVEIGENACGIMSKENLTISLPIVFPEIPEKIANLINTTDDLFEYIYRTQTKLTCKPNEDGTIEINSNKVAVSNLIRFPLSSHCVADSSEFCIVPQPFPEIGALNFQTGDMNKTLNMKRIPYESMNTVVIESQDDTWLRVRVLLHEDNSTITVNFTFRLEIIKSVKELVKALKFNNSVFTNGISMMGHKLDGVISEDKVVENETIEFWEKVLQIEGIFGLSFDCSLPITYNIAYEFEVLYRSLIDDKSYREDISVEPETGLYFSDKEEIQNQIGQEMAISYIQGIQWELLSQKFTSYSLTVLFNTIMDSIHEVKSINQDNQYFVRLRSVEREPMFKALKLFKTENEAIRYQLEANKDFNNFAEMMRNAEKIMIKR